MKVDQNPVAIRRKILIVDDEPGNIRVLAGFFKADYKLTVAKNGLEALECARSEPHPDIILLDIMMPDMTGYQVLEKLKADPKTRSIPVIFVTALDTQEDRTKGLALGAAGYVAKPVDLEEITKKVNEVLNPWDAKNP